jgi:hypothetical protein
MGIEPTYGRVHGACSVFSLLSKNESRLIISSVCLSVCPTLITFEPLSRFS